MIRKDSLLTGFSVSLGVAGALLLLFLGWRLLGALTAMMTPFIAALVLALIFDPVADRLTRRFPSSWPNKRLLAVVFVFLGLLIFLAALLAFIVPNLVAQTSKLITFFAPLTYKVERTRNDGRFIIVGKDVTGNGYVVKELQNDREYVFRVVAADSEGKQYVLKLATATPHTNIVHKESGSRTSGTVPKTTKSSEKDASTGNSSGEEIDAYSVDIPGITKSSPHATPTPLVNSILAPLLRSSNTPSPSPVPSPTGDDVDESAGGIGIVNSPTASSKSGNEQTSEVDTTRYNPDGATEATVASASPTPAVISSPGTAATPVVAVSPLVPVVTGVSPSPTNPSGALPTSTPRGGTVAQASPTVPEPPKPAPTPHPRVSSSPRATAARAQATNTKGEKQTEVRMPDAGNVIAMPGDGQVRLLWRPPVTAASGFDRLRTQTDQWLMEHRSIGPVKLPQNLAAIQAQYSAQLSEMVQQVSQRAADIIVGSVSTALTITLSLIIGFYLLVDFDRLRMRMFHLLPEQVRGEVLQIITDVGSVFGNYVRGMFTVASLYGVVSIGVFFALGMFFDIGLRGYALLLGVMAGVLYPVPFLGPILTTIVVTAVALATGATPIQGLITLMTVQIQNGIFDNAVTPRVVGQSVGLHPLATIFSLLLGAQLFGLLGMLLSVPLAASIQKLLIRLYPHLGEPTPMLLQDSHHKAKRRENTTAKVGTNSSSATSPVEPLPPS